MYAVIENGGKQYRVELGAELVVDRMDVEAGQTVRFDHVLLVADGDEASVGRPHVAGASVSADVVRQARGEKVVVFKYRPKARSRVKQGARADLTVLRIADIIHDGKSAARIAEAARTERERLEAAEAEAAAKQAEADKELARKLARTAAAAEAKATAARKTPEPAGKPAARGGAKTEAKPAGKPAAKPAKTSAKPATGGKAPATRTQAPQPPAKPAPRKKKED
ncbi:MAG TPA: 50S ribosomal protein L21 [Candidatus Sulfotelmatobacter sp.]|nr:50S ribosomal protein L21 [Candidatus Sulfotelmatobacter sp.]